MKKRVLGILSMLLALTFTFSACEGEQGAQGAAGAQGAQGEQGIQGEQGEQGVTPKLRISETTNEWEVSYDDGVTWSSLGVKATGEPGTKVEIGENGNWFLDGVDTGVKASGSSSAPEQPAEPTEFVPVTRFVVTSDIHLRENGALESQDRLEAVLDTAYAYAESQTDYSGLDGIFFAGDQTQNGSEAEQTAFFNTVAQKLKGDTVARAIMGNHEYYATGYYTEESMAQAPLNFLEFSGYEDDDAHIVVDGYHYIFASMDKYRGNTGKDYEYLSPTKIAWLKEELDKAVADDETGEKPIFVFQHVAAYDTVFGSTGGDKELRELLNDYPNVVDFSGHSHRALTDPQCIWQQEFTALNTGSMCYLSLNFAGHPTLSNAYRVEINDDGDLDTSNEDGVRNGNMYYICEISENHEMRILRYDAINEGVYGEPYYLDSFGDPTGFEYTSARSEASEAPAFAASAAVVAGNCTDTSIQLTFPQAACKDVVQNYRIEVYNGSTLAATEYKLSRSFLGAAMPQTLTATVDGLTANTEYTVKVFPVNSWGKAGEPLTGTATTEKQVVVNYTTLASFADAENGTVSNVSGYGWTAYKIEPTYQDGTLKAGFYLDRYHVDGGSTKLAAFKVTLPTGLDLTKDGIVVKVLLADYSNISGNSPDKFTMLTKNGQKSWQNTSDPTTFPNVTMVTDKTTYMELRVSSSQLTELGYVTGDTELYFGGWYTASVQRTAGVSLVFQLDEISHYEQVE
ncbi:MAG: metallophosphoesterase [Clostridia bacterium]|nr:metallophosphoesterase [Clostridia bacterium]